MKRTSTRILCLLFLLSMVGAVRAQGLPFIDTLYSYHDTTVTYGSATDFAGNVRSLSMDISYPLGDPYPTGGRPLMLLIHGGAWMAGSKADPGIVAMRKQFAQRGYVTAAINYRMGLFQTSSANNCNISWLLGLPWNCLNAADANEWKRACYRAMQDAHGAIRYLVNDSARYHLNAEKVFVVGESAGAFTAVAVGFMDVPSEKPAASASVAAVAAPNVLYENPCIQTPGFDTSIASMNLARPDLGPIEGTMNLPSIPYHVAGVGDMYGGMFVGLLNEDIFTYSADPSKIPCMYLFHQPNDLIVPFQTKDIFQDYETCTANNFGCGFLTGHTPVRGGQAMKDLIDAHLMLGDSVPDYLAEFTSNTADCAAQFFNASLGGHQYDSYWQRTYNMAVFFAPKAASTAVGAAQLRRQVRLDVSPNPTAGPLRLRLGEGGQLKQVVVTSLVGQVVWASAVHGAEATLQLPDALADGCYLVRVVTDRGSALRRVVVARR